MATLTARTTRRTAGGAGRTGSATARRVGVVLAGVVGVLCSALSVIPAQAAPPGTAAEVGRLMAARSHDLELLTEKFNVARERLIAEERLVGTATAKATAANVVLGVAQQQVRGIARTAFTGAGNNAFQTMMTSRNATDFVDRMTTLQTIAGRQNVVLQTAATASLTAAQARATAHKAAVDARAQYNALAAQQAGIKQQMATYQADFDRLGAAEKQAAAAAADGGAGAASRASRTDRSPLAPAGPIVANSHAAQTAVDTALAQRGKLYVWAAAGPGSFDCSGLTQYAYQAAGISLPHSAAMQAMMGQPVSRAQLQPGDLIFFYSPVSHVGIYIGNGQMVHAPTTGDVVKIANIDVMGLIAGARRLAG